MESTFTDQNTVHFQFCFCGSYKFSRMTHIFADILFKKMVFVKKKLFLVDFETSMDVIGYVEGQQSIFVSITARDSL